jgi:hypothetical protein
MQLSDKKTVIRKLLYVHMTCRSLDYPKVLAHFVDENLKKTLTGTTRNRVAQNPRYLAVGE